MTWATHRRAPLAPPRNLRALQGIRKGETFIVSFVGNTPWPTPTVYCDSGMQCDWRFAEHLHPVIVARPGVDWRHAAESLFDVQMRAGHAGAYPTFVDLEREQVANIVGTQPMQLWQAKRGSEPWLSHFG